ncbi:MAG: hypothetical protein KDD66_02785 [Bdellovibrionales bacterium]|nr:hypothetical protein [Bdellovibrionales bacterium]
MNDDDNEYDITEPLEGAGTLVAQFSIFQIDIIVDELKQLRAGGKSEADIKTFLDGRADDLDASSRSKILLLSQGEVPHDDFELSDIRRLEEVDPTKYEIELKSALQCAQLGSLVYFQGKRWIVTETEGTKISIKHL